MITFRELRDLIRYAKACKYKLNSCIIFNFKSFDFCIFLHIVFTTRFEVCLQRPLPPQIFFTSTYQRSRAHGFFTCVCRLWKRVWETGERGKHRTRLQKINSAASVRPSTRTVSCSSFRKPFSGCHVFGKSSPNSVTIYSTDSRNFWFIVRLVESFATKSP